MTGRGDIGKLEVFGEEINAALFSIKFLKSNWDTLTAHTLELVWKQVLQKTSSN